MNLINNKITTFLKKVKELGYTYGDEETVVSKVMFNLYEESTDLLNMMEKPSIKKINELKYIVDDVEVHRKFNGKWVAQGFLTKGQFIYFLDYIKQQN